MSTGLQEKARALPESIKAFFFDDEPMLLCEEVCMLYGLSEDDIPAASKPLGVLFIKELPLQEYPAVISRASGVDMAVAYGIAYEVNRRIFLRFPEYFTDAEALGRQWETQKAAPVVSLEEAKQKVLELEPWLLETDEDDEDGSVSAETGTAVRLPLLRAVSEYPNIGNQQITRERIRLQGRQDDVRPSLANWVKSYRNELGVGYHEPVVRAKFLFDSENGKKLSSEERERLNVIIRSIEENEPVEIDTERVEIVFPGSRIVERSPKPETRSRPPARRPATPVRSEQIAPNRPRTSSRPIVKPAPSFPDAPPHSADVGGGPVAASPGQTPDRPAAVTPPPAPRRRTPPAAAAPSDLPVSGGIAEAPPAPRESRPSGGTVSFSSGHALPGERSPARRPRVRYGESVPSQSPAPSNRAVSSASPADTKSGRVVNLREE